MIPGDRAYFKNKDNYLALHDGPWQGENCIYVGLNAANEATFSGLGLYNRTEDQLRDAMQNAYNTLDLVAPYPSPLPQSHPEYIDDTDAETEIRFTQCQRLKTGL